MANRFSLVAILGVAFALAALAGSPARVEAQFGKRLKERLKQNAEDKAIDKAVDEQNKAIDKATTGGGEDSSSTGAPTDAAGAAPAAENAAAAGAPAPGGKSEALKPGEGAWANYDFKPGDRVLYVEDFANDEIGDFPRRMEFKSGALEVVDWQGTRYLRANDDSKFFVVLPEILPDRFTMEFDYSIPSGGEVWISLDGEDGRGRLVTFGGSGTAGVRNTTTDISASGRAADGNTDKVRRARVMGDGKYVKAYLDDTRLLNVPNADLGRANKILFYTDGDVSKPTLFGNFRVAAGGKKLFDALTEKGRVATQGIYFDTGSDRLRPESTPTLKEIGTMLKEHPDLKLVIEGHTDNVGKPDANQSLSEKRAAAVRQHLIDSYQIDGGRLQAKALGQAKPAGSNDTRRAGRLTGGWSWLRSERLSSAAKPGSGVGSPRHK
ncbi:MAG: OmpA family protein, partial [Gemmatimonadales bacterium]